jgi:ABC-type multidrug transport system fused ATPase/permease subunit
MNTKSTAAQPLPKLQIAPATSWLLVTVSVFNTLSKVALSYTMGWFVNFAIEKEIRRLLLCGMGSVASLAAIYLFTVAATKIQARVTKQTAIDLKRTIFTRLLFNKNTEQVDVDAILNAVEVTVPTIANDYYLSLLGNIDASVQILLCSIALLFVNVQLFALCFVVSSVPLLLNPHIRKRFGRYKNDLNDASRSQLEMVSSILQGIATINAFGAVNVFQQQFAQSDSQMENKRQNSNVWDVKIGQLSLLISMSAQIICMLVAALYILNGQISVGALTITTQLLNYIFPGINKFNANHLKSVAAKPLLAQLVMMLPPAEKNQQTESFVPGRLEVNHVSFGYAPKTLILNDFSMSVPSGSKLAIIGESGSGKSTLLKLLNGTLMPTAGQITIGTKQIREYQDNTLLRNMVYVTQQPALFSGTVAENISMFGAIELANVQDELQILGLSNLLDRRISYHGAELSGGQKVRIAFARAIASAAPIILLDEPDSGQDPKTARSIDRVIRAIKTKTVIMITHRWDDETMGNFDQIIRLGQPS